MKENPKASEHHQHPGPQCKDSDRGTICVEPACRHDHHVSSHTEINCSPVKGEKDLYDCVHVS